MRTLASEDIAFGVFAMIERDLVSRRRPLPRTMKGLGFRVLRDDQLEDIGFDDHEIMNLAVALERRLEIHLPLPLMVKNVGELVDLCIRRNGSAA